MKTKLLSLAVAAAILSTGAASADQLEDIKARGTLICGTLGTAEPFSFADPQTRQIVGYDIDLCQAIADDLGVKMEAKPISVEARIPELVQGRIDIVAGNLGYTPERAEQIDYTTSYFVSLQKLLVKEGSEFDTIDSLAESRISAPKGSSSGALRPRSTASGVTADLPGPAIGIPGTGAVQGRCDDPLRDQR